MNYRNRQLLDLAYSLDCTLRIPGICTGGTGEPCHANDHRWGKGGAMKAHDFAFASGCRSCHAELDQGRFLRKELRAYYWLRGHVETMRQLWEMGLIGVLAVRSIEALKDIKPPELRVLGYKETRRKKSRCTRSEKTVPRGAGFAR